MPMVPPPPPPPGGFGAGAAPLGTRVTEAAGAGALVAPMSTTDSPAAQLPAGPGLSAMPVRLAGAEPMAGDKAWRDIPTCREAGLDVEYLMLRGIFMPAGATAPQISFYENLLARVRDTPEWREMMQQGAFNTTTMTGDSFRSWLEREETRHRTLMQEAGFLAQQG